jgi:hypothetical protein
MQIDFHHAATYALARLAGFPARAADTIAHSAQLVDDAVDQGAIEFSNGAMYQLSCSAHRMLDYRNFEALADHLAWLPFHFLPGNGGLPPGKDPEGTFVRKLVCLPDSPVARDMLRSVLGHKNRRNALHRLGIAMHTYADTWAHQGFVGVRHEINHATTLTGADGKHDMGMMERIKNYFVDVVLPLGHGTVLGNPDRPYLVWGYTNGLGERVVRDNPKDFLSACDHMVAAMQRFLAGDANAPVPGIGPRDRDVLDKLIRGITSEEEAERHAIWIKEIAAGVFSFGPETVRYIGEGEGSWKHLALGTLEEPSAGYEYRPGFLVSDWKLFHDALNLQRLDIVHHILPEYGICAA